MLEKIANIFSEVANIFGGVYDFLIDFGQTCVNVLSYIVSGLGFIWYGGKTLIVGTFKLVAQVVSGSVFLNVNNAFIYISHYIGLVPTVFLSAGLLLAIIRIIIAFVFKILRLNIDYNSFDKQTRKANSWDNASEYRKKVSTRV